MARPDEAFRPYVEPSVATRELTLRAIVLGSLLGIVFAASIAAYGLIAGGALAGVLQSVVAFYEAESFFDLGRLLGSFARGVGAWPLVPFGALALFLYFAGRRRHGPDGAAG